MGVYFTNTGLESYCFSTTHFYKKGLYHDDHDDDDDDEHDDDDVHEGIDATYGVDDDGARDDVRTFMLCYVRLLT
jgi:hypothetical protein